MLWQAQLGLTVVDGVLQGKDLDEAFEQELRGLWAAEDQQSETRGVLPRRRGGFALSAGLPESRASCGLQQPAGEPADPHPVRGDGPHTSADTLVKCKSRKLSKLCWHV